MPRKPLDPSRSTREKHRISASDYARRRREGVQDQPCEVCGAEPAECHHIDYSDPQRRMWLCTRHHAQTHSQFARPAPLDWMADIRAAVRRIEASRLSARTNQEDDWAVDVESD